MNLFVGEIGRSRGEAVGEAYQMKVSERREGSIWKRVGRRHDQWFGHSNVPSVTPAARIAPTYHDSV
jgi:hypothetical protein